MKTLVLKKADGTVERFTGNAAAEQLREEPISKMAWGLLLAGSEIHTKKGIFTLEDDTERTV